MTSDTANETLILQRIKNEVTVGFHPSYLSRNFGVDFGEKYHKDPFFRFEQDKKARAGVYKKFGDYGIGNPDMKMQAVSVSIQPLDFLNGALGGKMCYSHEEHVWTPEKPLEKIENIEDVKKMPDIEWAENPLLRDFIKQTEQLREKHPELPVTGIQGLCFDGGGEKCCFVIHTPYTTAFRLFGEKIFEMMMLEPETAWAILDYIMCQYFNLMKYLSEKLAWKTTKIHFGDCAATMLSPSLYEQFSLVQYTRIMENMEGCTIHSCGPSSHLLEHFARVPKVRHLQLGDGTDLKKTREFFPDSSVFAYYAPFKLLNDSPEDIERKLWKMAEDLQDNFRIAANSIDPSTPEEKIHLFLKTGQKILDSIKDCSKCSSF